MKTPKTRTILFMLAAMLVGSIMATYVHSQEAAAGEELGKIRSAVRSAKYQDALKDVNILLTKNPTNANAWCLKGEIQTRLKDATAALESFSKAVQANKASINAVVGKANALAELKKETEAQELLRQSNST